MKFIIETKKKKHIFVLFHHSSYEDSKELKGFTNKCPDSQYVIFLDYDGGWTKEEVEANKIFLEKKYLINFHYLFKTNKGFHLISLDKVAFNRLRDILEDSLADPSFVKVPFMTSLHSSTLRLSEKAGNIPELIKQYLDEVYFRCYMSGGHYELLKVAYPEIQKPKGDFDDTTLEDVQVVTYWSKPR